jgi:hypothetical protein
MIKLPQINNPKLVIILLVFAGIMIIILVSALFAVYKPQKEREYKVGIAYKDSLIAEKDKHIRALSQVNYEKDQKILIYQRNDSLAQSLISTNYNILNILKKLDAQHDQISRNVNSLTAAELKRAFANY